jgi:hypothetical protein
MLTATQLIVDYVATVVIEEFELFSFHVCITENLFGTSNS